MSLNKTPASERLHIGIFGCRNAGKSSIINAITGQPIAIVSDVKGTTTDPVYKTMELLPLGPVMIIDTPGIDDEGELGEQRVQRSYQVLNKTDVAVLVVDGVLGLNQHDNKLIERIKKKKIPYLVVYNRLDLVSEEKVKSIKVEDGLWVSALTLRNIDKLKEEIGRIAAIKEPDKRLIGDLLEPNHLVVLVVHVDAAAPKNRLILPQQQTIRDIIASDAIPIIAKDTNLASVLSALGQKPRLVITDSQVFDRVSPLVPEEVELTSFSILFNRYKGNLALAVKGAAALDKLKAGDRILISEGCTHHRQCEDIGTVKLPGWIEGYTGKKFEFEFTSGGNFHDNLESYALIVHCGACMLTEREMKYRLQCAEDQGVAMTNYGILIAYMNGILKRSVAPFEELVRLI